MIQNTINKNKITSIVSDVVALANVESNSIDSKVKSFQGDKIVVDCNGNDSLINKYVVVGGEIVRILSYKQLEDNLTEFTVKRGMYSTARDIEVGSHFRTVVILDSEELNLLSWEFEDTLGGVGSNLFPVELGSGNIALKSDLNLWSPYSKERKYKVKPKNSIAYIFKRIGDKHYLKFTTVISKVRYNTRGKREPNKIVLDIKTKLAKWYEKPLAINKQLKSVNPKEFFKLLFDLEDNEVYYCNGVDDSSFLTINNLHTKEYETMSELLKAYCSNGVRFIFDSKEKVKIFSDFKTESILPCKEVNYNITDLMLSDNEQMIYNTINTKSYQRQTLFNFEELDSKYVKYFKKLLSAVDSRDLLSLEPNGDILAKSVEISNSELRDSVQLKDYIMLKRTKNPCLEFQAQVVAINDTSITVMPILKDKDYKTFPYGKNTYLYNLLVNIPCKLDVYFGRYSLPIVFKYTRNKNKEEVDSSLNFPILPRVDGETKYSVKTNINFGCASNLKVGKYTGIVEEISGIYGTWNSKNLKYNREMEQFSNEDLPPIFALSNHVEERLTSDNIPIKNYTTFDNSDLLIEISQPKSNDIDAKVEISNEMSINSDIDLFVDKEIGRYGNKILQVEDIENYKLGDVLIVNKEDDLDEQEELEFDEVLKNIRWTIVAKTSQKLDGKYRHFIYVDSPFAKRKKKDKVYSFTKFPNWSVVFLQELYFRGNPLIEYEQEVYGYSKSTNVDGDTSVELYGEKKYDFDSKQLDKLNLRKMMGYILHNFSSTDINTTKFTLPISLINALDLETLDVIRVIDPIYTKVTEEFKWVILSMKHKSSTNEIDLKLLNLNNKNVEPYKVEIEDVMQYEPIEIPEYNHAGGEGNPEGNNDGQGGTDVDKSLGQFWLSEVDSKSFRARIEKMENNYIYFKDFNGEEVEQYKGKLFPSCEFAINVNGEVLFVRSDMNYRAYVKKRQVYDTEEAIITPEDDVTFLVTTTYVDIDGTFYGRKMMMGDGDSYLSVDPIKGVKIVGDFVVGENNKNSDNDLWQSLQNNRTFQQDERPENTPSYLLKKGDIWYDTNDENHCYCYDGSVWVSARDGSIVSTKNNIYIQSTEPVSTEGKEILEGDTWYDTSEGNKPFVYQNGQWVNVTDTTLQEAIDKVQEQAQESTDKLRDLADDNKITPSEKQQILLEIERIKAEYPSVVSECEKFGITTSTYDRRYDNVIRYTQAILNKMDETTIINKATFNSNFIEYYEERQHLFRIINSKIEESATKNSKGYADNIVNSLGEDLTKQIDGKIETYNQTTDPSIKFDKPLDHEGDLWYNTDSRELKRWNGYTWVLMDSKDSVAEALAKSKKQIFTSTPQPPYSLGDLWIRNKELYVCLEENSSSFLEKDWSKATRYTDDTFAEEVEKKTEKALNELSDIANDNKLTPSEKQFTKKEWDNVVLEHPKYIAQASMFEVSFDVMNEAYDNLKKYVEPLIRQLDTVSNIDGNVFRNTFNTYYEERQNVLSEINKKTKDLVNKAQNDATTALGNAKIFYQTTQPSSGMKENDLWYDTDDGNHPYIYKGGRWQSARDMIFETEGGNKVYFQNTQPPTNGKGIKEGDQWFDTAHNNSQYVLLKKDGRLVWTLGSDALDKINNGRIVLNSNTTVNGDFKVKGKNVELSADTKVRGLLEVFSNDEGIISYNGTNEANSTQRIVIRGGEILFQEKF